MLIQLVQRPRDGLVVMRRGVREMRERGKDFLVGSCFELLLELLLVRRIIGTKVW